MQHIVFVITQSSWGGAQRYVADLATHLPRDRFRVTVIVGEGDGALTRVLERVGITVHTIPFLHRAIRPLADIRALFALRRPLRRLAPDVVHCNSTKAGLLGVLAARAASIPRILFTAHGFAFQEPHGGLVQWLLRAAEQITITHAHVVIAVSDADRAAALHHRLVASGKIQTIHNGVSIDASRALSRADARQALQRFGVHASSATPLVGCIANFYPTKDLSTLLNAAAIVHREMGEVRFVVIGEGRTRAALEALRTRLDLDSVVTFTGAIDDAWTYWRAFDCAVLSSVKEGLPYTLIEASALGIPIVATRVGGIPEIVQDGDNGLLVPPHDPHALAGALTTVLRDPAWKQHAEAAAPRIREHFSLERMVQETLHLYVS